jgi:hypothetical protein
MVADSLDVEQITTLYLEERLNTTEIGKIFGVSKTPVRQILIKMGVLRKGKSSGIKVKLSNEDEEKIKKLYLEYKNCEEIGNEMNLTASFIDKYLTKQNYRRTRSQGVSVGLVKRYRGINYNDYLDCADEFYQYELAVLKYTRRQDISKLENFEKRGNSGVEGAYHLDHKYSLIEGFRNGVKPEIIGNIKNLEFIPWKDNIKKRAKCSITINELIN